MEKHARVDGSSLKIKR